MRYGEIEDSWENQKECKEEIVLHDFVILYNKKGGEQKSRGKIKFMGKNWEALLYIRDYEYP
jgi:hypothetical protein